MAALVPVVEHIPVQVVVAMAVEMPLSSSSAAVVVVVVKKPRFVPTA